MVCFSAIFLVFAIMIRGFCTKIVKSEKLKLKIQRVYKVKRYAVIWASILIKAALVRWRKDH